jgi:hypothetical protein
MTKKKRRPGHHTQWAAQFAVASELCKIDYLVALTLGNHPAADLMVVSPRGDHFLIDVKGLRGGSTWLVKRQTPIKNLFYVLALVPPGKSNQFFIMSQAEADAIIRGDGGDSDIRKPDAMRYLDRWDALPA